MKFVLGFEVAESGWAEILQLRFQTGIIEIMTINNGYTQLEYSTLCWGTAQILICPDEVPWRKLLTVLDTQKVKTNN